LLKGTAILLDQLAAGESVDDFIDATESLGKAFRLRLVTLTSSFRARSSAIGVARFLVDDPCQGIWPLSFKDLVTRRGTFKKWILAARMMTLFTPRLVLLGGILPAGDLDFSDYRRFRVEIGIALFRVRNWITNPH
jgi:hypothetical protein